MDLRLPIVVSDELEDDVITASALLDLASGEILKLEYADYDPVAEGFPWARKDYEFSSGVLSNKGKDLEFSVEVDKSTGHYSVNASELGEIKKRAAALFSGNKA